MEGNAHTSSTTTSPSPGGMNMTLMALTCAFLSWILIHRWTQMKNKGPKTWPVVGATIEQLMNYDRMHDWLVEYLSKWRTITVSMPLTSYTYTADPANVEHVLKTNFNNYPKGEVFHSYMEVLLGDGIFNADGEKWRKQRKTASLEFASKNLRDFSTTVFREYAMKLSTILCHISTLNQQVDMQELLMRMTLDSICKIGFGAEIETLSPELPDNLFASAFDMANMIVTLRFFDPLWRIKRFLHLGYEALLNKSIKVVDDFTYSIVQKRKAEIEEARTNGKKEKTKHDDILSRFIELGENPESNMSDKELRDVVLNFVIAGRDTTAATLSWFIYMIITHPRVADKLYAELIAFEEDRAKEENVTFPCDPENPPLFNQSISQFAKLLTYESLGRLNYLHAAVTETLRLYPAVPQDPKGILEDDILPDGTQVKAGGLVAYVPYSMGRMEYIWGPDATSFNPDRWLKEGVLQSVSPFRFTAFQAGPRICLGKDSAYLQMKMTLAILCRFFLFALVPKHPVRYRMMAILSMAHGLKVTVSKRS